MSSEGDHAPGYPASYGQMMDGTPPLNANFFTVRLPAWRNASKLPSGEKNGAEPVAVPGSAVACKSSRRRWKIWVRPPASEAAQAKWAPSGESCTDEPTGAMISSWPRGIAKRVTRGMGVDGRSSAEPMPVSAAPTIIAAATTTAHEDFR